MTKEAKTGRELAEEAQNAGKLLNQELSGEVYDGGALIERLTNFQTALGESGMPSASVYNFLEVGLKRGLKRAESNSDNSTVSALQEIKESYADLKPKGKTRFLGQGTILAQAESPDSIIDREGVKKKAVISESGKVVFESTTPEDFIEDAVDYLVSPHPAGNFPSSDQIGSVTGGNVRFLQRFLNAYSDEMGWDISTPDSEAMSQIAEKLEEEGPDYEKRQTFLEVCRNSFPEKVELDKKIDKLTKKYVPDILGKVGSDDEREKQFREKLHDKKLLPFLSGIAAAISQHYTKLSSELDIDDMEDIFNMTVSRTVQILSGEREGHVGYSRFLHIAQSENARVPDRLEVYKRLIQEAGWENNIGMHGNEIIDLFGGFETFSSFNHLENYIKLLRQQVGWEISMPENRKEMVEKFYRADQEKAKVIIEDRLADGEEKRKSPRQALRDNEDFYDSDPMARYFKFIKQLVNDQLDTKEQELVEFRKSYGHKEADALIYLTGQYFQVYYFDKLSDRSVERLEEDGEKRIDRLIDSYLP